MGDPVLLHKETTGSVGTLRTFPLTSKEAWEPETRNCLWFAQWIRIEKRHRSNNTDRKAIWNNDADKT